jgi:dienelactone hydrolase
MSLAVTPETALIDQPVTITVTGCAPKQTVVLRAVCFDDDGLRWESRATFEANEDGRVDPARHAPKYGTYSGVDPMGLFWSMLNDEGPDSRTMFADEELDPLHVVIQLEIDGEVRESRRLVRQRILPRVTRREVRERGLVGTLFLPEAESSVGAVIVVGGSDGGLSEGSAALLASRGFAALALAYFKEESLPDELVEIPLEYFETAIGFLGEHEMIDADRIAVQGPSRGGELALLLGATFPEIRAVVAFVPSGVIWPGCCSPEAMKRPAWTYKGEPITPLEFDLQDPDMQARQAKERAMIQAGEPLALTPKFRLAVEKATNVQAATIPVERTRGPILLISGQADDLWPSRELAEISVRRLHERKFPFPFDHVSYEDAGHVFDYPFRPTTVSEVEHPLSPVVMKFGGTPAGNARAARKTWSRVLAFYRETIGRQKD